MRLRLAKMSLVVLLLALSAVPSGAGPFHVRYWVSSGGLAITPLADGSVALAGIWATRQGYQEGNIILPFTDGTPVVNLVPDPQNPTFIGCIFIVGKSAFDYGCEIAPPSSVTMDPAMRTATLVFSVLNSQGYTLTATLILEGVGDPTPMEGSTEPVLSDDPGAENFPRIAFASGLLGFLRTASVQGAVRSEMTGLGGATRSGQSQHAWMTQGLFNPVRQGNLIEFRSGYDVHADTTKPACLADDNCLIP